MNKTFRHLLHFSRESEYAAWTLVNGYAVNHVTISTHRLQSHLRSIGKLNQFIEEHGYKLNSEGGVLKGLCSVSCFIMSLLNPICLLLYSLSLVVL